MNSRELINEAENKRRKKLSVHIYYTRINIGRKGNCIRMGERLGVLFFRSFTLSLCTKSISYGGMNISTQFHLADLNSRVFFLWCKMIFNSHLNVLIMQYIRIEIVKCADCICSGCATIISYHICNMTENRFMMMCGMQMSL